MSRLPDVHAAVRELAGRRPLLVALDFDGVLAPIVDHPADARALPGALEVISALAAVPGISAAIVSGRAREDLRSLTGGPSGVVLVGSHGAELDDGGPDDGGLDDGGLDDGGLDDGARARLDAVLAVLEPVARRFAGVAVEVKPSAGVLHTRRAAPADAEAATAQARSALAALPGVHVTLGKQVVEAAVLKASKGAAIRRLRERIGAAGVLYAGDDVTDETVFATLGPGDVGIKVGDGPTAAAHRLPDPGAVRSLLQDLAALVSPARDAADS